MERQIKNLLDKGQKSAEHSTSHLDKELTVSCRQFFTKKVEFHKSNRPDSHLEHLRSLYKPLNPNSPSFGKMENDENTQSQQLSTTASTTTTQHHKVTDGVPQPKRILFDSSLLKLTWNEPRKIGAGLSNLGNTCFLNSVLQCLTYTPPLINYLNSQHHSQICSVQGFCAMCAFHKHCTRVFSAPNGVQKPLVIVHNMKAIGKHFRLGRQEDAHEFLRYFIDGLQKSCLHSTPAKLDPHSKATTVVHQIFGGYHRSQVKCLQCLKTSDTFDPLLDLSVDIKGCSQLTRALERSTKPDKLDGENRYACPFCKKMTPAQKRFTVHRLPRVLTIQLKRFDYQSMFGGKINKEVSYPEHLDMRPYTSEPQGSSEWYRLYGVLVHYGYSCHAGHYTCFVRNSSGFWYSMNDAQVTQVSKNTALAQEAYLLFYIRDEGFSPPPPPPGASPLAAAAGKNQSPKAYKEDPNFLGTPVKRPHQPLGGLDKTGTPLVKVKPTGVVPPSPVPLTIRTANIPLRKCSIPSSSNKLKAIGPSGDNNQAMLTSKQPQTAGASKIDTSPSNSVQTPPPTLPRLNPAFVAPGFTPRALSNKLTKPKSLASGSKVLAGSGSRVKLPPLSSRCSDGRLSEGGNSNSSKPAASAVPCDSATSQIETSLSILDIADMTHPSATPPQSSPSSAKFTGPLLPPQNQQQQQQSQLLSPTSGGAGDRKIPRPFPGKSPSPKVALVAPRPHLSLKPVARVAPSPQVRHVDAEPHSSKAAIKRGWQRNRSASGEDENMEEEPLVKGMKGGSESIENNASSLPNLDNGRQALSAPSSSSSSAPTLTSSSSASAYGPDVPATLPSLSITPFSFKSPRGSAKPSIPHSSSSTGKGKRSQKHKKKHRKSTPDSSSSDSESEEDGRRSSAKKHSDSDRRDCTPKKKHSESKDSRKSRSKVSDSSTERERRHKKHKRRRHRSSELAAEEEEGHSDGGDDHHSRSRKGKHSKSRKRKHQSSSCSESDHRSPSPPSHSKTKSSSKRHSSPKGTSSRHHSSHSSSHGHHKSKHRDTDASTDEGHSRRSHCRSPDRKRHKHSQEDEKSREDQSGESPQRHHKEKHSRSSKKKDRHPRHCDRDSSKLNSSTEEEKHRRKDRHNREASHKVHSSEDDDDHHSTKKKGDSHRHDTSKCDTSSDSSSSIEEDRHKRKDRQRRSGGDSSASCTGDEKKLKRKRSHSHREVSPSPDSHKKRHCHKSEESGSTQHHRHKKLSPVPEVEWDKVGIEAAQRWDGARHSKTVEHLTGHSHSKLGSQVLSWDGGENSVDAAAREEEEEEDEGGGGKRVRDSYEQELDKGRTKKVRRKLKGEMDTATSPRKNPFQQLQDKKTLAAGNRL